MGVCVFKLFIFDKKAIPHGFIVIDEVVRNHMFNNNNNNVNIRLKELKRNTKKGFSC